MSDPQSKRPLADDPNFLASLSELDIGLNDPGGDEGVGIAEEWPAEAELPPPPPPRPLAPLSSTQAPAPSAIRVESAGQLRPAESFYRLRESPFDVRPDLRFLYRSASFDSTVQGLLNAIGRRDGIVLLTGDEGIGKTTICQFMMTVLDRRTVTSLVSGRMLTADELLKTVLVDFGVISKGDIGDGRLTAATHAELMTALRGFLASLDALQASAVLVIDDAHLLPLEVMQQVRLLSEVTGSRLLQMVMVGGPELPGLVDQYELRQLNQAVTARIQIGPLAATELRAYVAHRLAVAGSGSTVELDPAAQPALFGASGGNPKTVNRICERALALGSERSAGVLDARLINEAAAGVVDLPVPQAGTGQRVLRTALIAVCLAMLVVIGAAGAAFVFRAPFSRMVARWQGVPSVQTPPSQR